MTRWILATALLTGCTLPMAAPLALQPASQSEYAPYRIPGKASVSGQAFLTTVGGEVRHAAGARVTLDPATSLARAWCAAVCDDRGSRKNGITDSMFLAARRSTTADADGRFAFTGIPAGQYLLQTGVTWSVGYLLQGGLLTEIVDVPDSGAVNVIMSKLGNPYARRSGG